MININLQIAANISNIPTEKEFTEWVNAALNQHRTQGELTVRIVDVAESKKLNNTYRQKNMPTNILTFPFEQPPDITLPLLGDIIICAPLVSREAEEQGKSERSHWAHLVIHGCLHLIGYDHQNDAQATIMEALEIQTMQQLGFTNPYIIE